MPRLQTALDALATLKRRSQFVPVDPATRMFGWELESTLIDKNGHPAFVAHRILELLGAGYIPEFFGCQVERNAPPAHFAPGCFTELERRYRAEADILRNACRTAGLTVDPAFLSLSLPLREAECGEADGALDLVRMRQCWSPSKAHRYEAMNPRWQAHYGPEVDLRFPGGYRRIVRSVALEGLMNAVHHHLQVSPDELPRALNLGYFLAAFALAPFVSSPRWMGHDLEVEDVRHFIWKQLLPKRSGVGFGWVTSLEDYVARVMNDERFPVLVPVPDDEDVPAVLGKDGIPKLTTMCVRMGTVWPHVRPKYIPLDSGVALTIEARHQGTLSPADNTASAALWTGMMKDGIDRGIDVTTIPGGFDTLQANYEAVALGGLSSTVTWLDGRVGPVGRFIQDELLPWAERAHYSTPDAAPYLANVAATVAAKRTPASWVRESAANLRLQGLTDEVQIDRRIMLTAAAHLTDVSATPMALWTPA